MEGFPDRPNPKSVAVMLYVTSLYVPGLAFIKTGLLEITKLPNTGAASSLILILNVRLALFVLPAPSVTVAVLVIGVLE